MFFIWRNHSHSSAFSQFILAFIICWIFHLYKKQVIFLKPYQLFRASTICHTWLTPMEVLCAVLQVRVHRRINSVNFYGISHPFLLFSVKSLIKSLITTCVVIIPVASLLSGKLALYWVVVLDYKWSNGRWKLLLCCCWQILMHLQDPEYNYRC